METPVVLPGGAEQSLASLIKPFVAALAAKQIDIYNEPSVQHELGIFLRTVFPADKVQFERNVSFFFPSSSQFVKREIDIVVHSGESRALKWAIELKYPRNGQYPEQIFSFCKDVMFAEQLKSAGFANAAAVILADDKLFWKGPTTGIYGYFRGGRLLNGVIEKPTGARNETVTIRGSYALEWKEILPTLMCAVIEV